MAIIYGNAISIGYATSGSSVGGTYSIWLTIPAVATSVIFTAVKGDVSVPSTYISTIGAAKITLPETEYEGDWTITGTVGGKTANKTVTVKSGTVDYFVDFRNDFIPLVGDLAVGNLVTFDNKSWRVVHQEGTHWYLASEKIVSQTPFGSSNAYKHSTIAGVAATYESEQLSETAKEYCLDVTVGNVTNKVFIPTYAQVNSGFSYYNSNANRICQLKSTNSKWWTSSPKSGAVYYVNTDGAILTDVPDPSLGFRPHICIKYYPIGFDFTYTGTCNIRTDGVIEFLTSGDFIPNETLNIDAFLVGGGASGSGGNNSNNVKYAGGGGSGGYTLTKKNISVTTNTTYNIQIGEGGIATKATSALVTSAIMPGGDTTAFGFTASGGKGNSSTSTSTTTKRITGGDGGCGGGSGSSSSTDSKGTGGSNGNNGGGSFGGKGQGTTTREFGEFSGKLYAAGGGGGQYNTSPINKGGDGGGGNGANIGTAATAGTPNTGAGGGGGSVSANYNGASGGSGIVCIRLHKDTIPLTGDLAVGNTVTFDDKSFIVVHNDGTKWYLASKDIIENTVFGSSTSYAGSTLAGKCTSYLSNFSELAQKYMIDVTVENVTAKVFIPIHTQISSGEFSYYAAQANRVAKLNGSAISWWTSSSGSSSSHVYYIGDDGLTYSERPSASKGFRPHICVDTSLSG